VRAAAGLGETAIENLSGLVESFGIDVATCQLPDGLHGLLVADPARGAGMREDVAGPVELTEAVALVNSADLEGRQRFTLAHELAHFLFGDATDLLLVDFAGQRSSVEARADAFAAHLLAPDGAVRAFAAELGLTKAVTDAQKARLIAEVSLRFGMSVESATYRCQDNGLLSAEDARALAKGQAYRLIDQAGRSGARAERDRLQYQAQPPEALLAQALYAYREGMLGLRPVAAIYDTDDLEALAKEVRAAGWAPAYDTV
jgi:Zn-dependent peptidase ImmA (M78 family)